MKIKKKQEILMLAELCIIFNFSKFYFSIKYANPGLQTAQDIFSTLYSAAYFGGKDWTDIGTQYSAYYGYGFCILFSWLYRICSDGLFIYRFILICCQLLTVISCMIAYEIIGYIGVQCSRRLKYFICIACTAIQSWKSCGILNEHMLSTMVWVILYLLLSLIRTNNIKIRRIYTIFLGLSLTYTCTVHSRAILIYPLVILTIIAIIILYKTVIVNIPIFVAGIFLLIPYELFTKMLQMKLLGKISANSSVVLKVSNGLRESFDIEQIQSYILSVTAYFHETILITAGMAAVCLGYIVYALAKWILEKKKIDIITVCYGIYTLGGILIFLLGICFTTRSEIYRALFLQVNEYMRYLTLVRYFMPFVSPFLMFGLVELIKVSKIELKKVSSWSMSMILLVQAAYTMWVYPLINYTGWGNDVYATYLWDRKMEKREIYLVGMLLYALLSTIIIFCMRKRKWWLMCVVIYIHTMAGFTYQEYHQYTKSNKMVYVDAGYKYFLKDEHIKDIYVVVDAVQENGEHKNKLDITQYYFLYQLLLPDKHIIPNDVPDDIDNAVVLTDNPKCVKNYSEYEISQLDDNEWLLQR